MKVCSRAVNFIQIINAEGDVRVCSWMRNNIIGNLLRQDMSDILHSNEAENIRIAMQTGDYSACDVDNCPYLSNNRLEDILIDIEEIPNYPSELYLAYEGVCNYQCTCCTSCKHMEDTKKNDYSTNYELLEKKLEKILPYVKTISANGRGELFASKRIIRLLQTWKPVAPDEDVKVILETNGSLFDERHWNQIENLGKYQVYVAITIMSFDEKIYQHLSGTKIPITRIEDNLRYVKKLRESGVINQLELATVLQEENFREMPEFTKRCIEEFGADIVRIRPIFPGGIYDPNIQWFMDVRNPEHPYYEQYREIMRNPIFQNPKVLLWSGDYASEIGKHPGIKAEAIRKAVDTIVSNSNIIENLCKGVKEKNFYLYGIGTLGKLFIQLSRDKIAVEKICDQYSGLEKWEGRAVIKPEQLCGKSGIILSTVYGCFDEVKNCLLENRFNGEVWDLFEIIKEEFICGK